MRVRFGLFAFPMLALVAPDAFAQPGRAGVPPAPLYLPPPPVHPQGLASPIAPRPLGYHVAPYGGLGYGPLGDRTGYPGRIDNTYRGSYLTPPTLPPLRLETPSNLPLRSGKLPTIVDLFPGGFDDARTVPRMPEPTPPGEVVPVGEKK